MNIKQSKIKVRDALKNSIIRLLLNDPFFGCLLLRLKVIIDKRYVKTMGTDGVYLVVNPEWVESLTFNQLTGVACHEAWHIAMKHILRRGTRDHALFNKACDYAIDQHIVANSNNKSSQKYELPDGGHIDSRFKGMSAEKIYDILLDEQKTSGGKQGGSGNGMTMIDPNAPPSTPAEGDTPNSDVIFDVPFLSKEDERAFEEALDLAIQAAAAGAGVGRLPGVLALLLESRHKHVINYAELLRDWLNKNVNKQDYNWLYCDRRFAGSGFHIPGLFDSSEQMPKVLLVSDVSGSMLGKGLQKVADEINGVLQEFPTDYYCIHTDTIVEGVQHLEPGDSFKLECEHGGGGTNFRKVQEHLKTEAEVEFDAILFFTDLYVDDFGDDPEKPVLWMNTSPRGEVPVPFGKVIDIRSDDG